MKHKFLYVNKIRPHDKFTDKYFHAKECQCIDVPTTQKYMCFGGLDENKNVTLETLTEAEIFELALLKKIVWKGLHDNYNGDDSGFSYALS